MTARLAAGKKTSLLERDTARSRRKLWMILGLLFASGYGSLRLWDLFGPNEITPSQETTYFTQPLLPDGTVDIVTAFNETWDPKVPPEKNAAPVVMRLVYASDPKLTDEFRQAITSTLGFDASELNSPVLTTFHDFIEDTHPEELPEDETTITKWTRHKLEPTQSSLWRAESHPMVAEWLAANADALAILHENSDRVTYFRPAILLHDESLLELLLPDGELLRETANMFVSRSLLRANDGDVAGSVSDLQIAYRISDWLGQSPFQIMHLVCAAASDACVAPVKALLREGILTAEHSRALKRHVESLREPTPVHDAVDRGDRITCMHMMMKMRERQSRRAWGGISMKDVRHQMINWNALFRSYHAVFDQGVAIERNTSDLARYYEEQKAFVRQLIESKETDVEELASLMKWRGRSAAGRRLGQAYASMAYPFTEAAVNSRVRMLARRNMVMLGLALLEFYTDHQQFPETLADLSLRYLSPDAARCTRRPDKGAEAEMFDYKVTEGTASVIWLGFDRLRDTRYLEDWRENSDDDRLLITPPNRPKP